jgi:hypothetical protein
MSFDIAVGLSNNGLNNLGGLCYIVQYPKVFTGSEPAQHDGVPFTVAYDVQAAPQFDLTPVTPEKREALLAALQARITEENRGLGGLDGVLAAAAVALPVKKRDAFIAAVRAQFAGENRDPGGLDGVLAMAATALPNFSVIFPTVALTLTGPSTTQLTLPLTAQCTVQLSGSTLSLVAYQVTAPPQPDPVTNWLVQNVVVPQILSIAQSMLSSINIPSVSAFGIPLSSPAIGIVQDCLIAVASAAASGTPPPPDGSILWPASRFFALIGQNILQDAVTQVLAEASNNFSDSGDGGDWLGGYSWSYSLQLSDPVVSFQQAESSVLLQITFGVSGNASAGVHAMGLSAGVGVDVSANPNISVVSVLQSDAVDLSIDTQSVSQFEIDVSLSGVPGWVAGGLLDDIMSDVASSFSGAITQYLNEIHIAVLNTTYTLNIGGQPATISLVNINTGITAGYFGVSGDFWPPWPWPPAPGWPPGSPWSPQPPSTAS